MYSKYVFGQHFFIKACFIEQNMFCQHIFYVFSSCRMDFTVLPTYFLPDFGLSSEVCILQK